MNGASFAPVFRSWRSSGHSKLCWQSWCEGWATAWRRSSSPWWRWLESWRWVWRIQIWLDRNDYILLQIYTDHSEFHPCYLNEHIVFFLQSRAKQLFNAGYKTLSHLANADPKVLSKTIENLYKKQAYQMVASARVGVLITWVLLH